MGILQKPNQTHFELKLATKWLNELKTQAETMGVDTGYKYWPKIASQLTLRLKQLKKSLVAAGIEVVVVIRSKNQRA